MVNFENKIMETIREEFKKRNKLFNSLIPCSLLQGHPFMFPLLWGEGYGERIK